MPTINTPPPPPHTHTHHLARVIHLISKCDKNNKNEVPKKIPSLSFKYKHDCLTSYWEKSLQGILCLTDALRSNLLSLGRHSNFFLSIDMQLSILISAWPKLGTHIKKATEDWVMPQSYYHVLAAMSCYVAKRGTKWLRRGCNVRQRGPNVIKWGRT